MSKARQFFTGILKKEKVYPWTLAKLVKTENGSNIEHDFEQISNHNLLINGDFQVWQRGEAFTDASKLINTYTADRWRMNLSGVSDIRVVKQYKSYGMLIDKKNEFGVVEIIQIMERADLFLGKAMTISFKGLTENKVLGGKTSFTLTNDNLNHINETDEYYIGMNYVPLENKLIIKFGIKKLKYVILDYVKLEHGTMATSFVPRSYGEECALCRRYFEQARLYAHVVYAYNQKNVLACFNFSEKRVAPTFTSLLFACYSEVGTPMTHSYAEMSRILKNDASYSITFPSNMKDKTEAIWIDASIDAEIY